jgi:hypothetical protein
MRLQLPLLLRLNTSEKWNVCINPILHILQITLRKKIHRLRRSGTSAGQKEWVEQFLTIELSPEHKELFIDNHSQTSYARMLALPLQTKPDLRLKDRDVSVGLTTRV